MSIGLYAFYYSKMSEYLPKKSASIAITLSNHQLSERIEQPLQYEN
jgi:hypothetical protein